MNRKPILCILAALLFLGAPAAIAQSSAGHQQDVYTHDVTKVAGLIEAGTMDATLTYPTAVAEVGDVFRLGATFSGPIVLGAFASITHSTNNLVGCTAGTPVNQASPASVTGAYAYYNVPITMTDTTCSGSMDLTFDIGLVPVEIWSISRTFTVHTLDGARDQQESLEITAWPDLDVEITAWPQLSVAIASWPELFASVNVTDWPELFATVNAWPEVFASVNVTDWPQLAAILTGNLDLAGTFQVNGVDLDFNQTIGNQNNTFLPGSFDAGGEAQQQFVDFIIPALFLIGLIWSVRRTYAAGPRYLGHVIFFFFGVIAVLFPGFIPIAAVWVSLAGLELILLVLIRFGTQLPGDT